jgi:apolipoprotein N-acyltransferase
VFLLRVTRTSRVSIGALSAGLIGGVSALWWVLQMAIPLSALVIGGAVGIGVASAVPYVVDRLLMGRLGMLGALFVFPATATAMQYLVATINPFGAAYGVTAVTQHGATSLLQLIAITGPFGITFVVMTASTVANMVWSAGRITVPNMQIVGAYLAVLAVIVSAGSVRLTAFLPAGPTVRVAGINPGKQASQPLISLFDSLTPKADRVPQLDPRKVDAAFASVNDDLFVRTRQAAQQGARIVVWSEQAANVRQSDLAPFLARASMLARETQIYLQVAVFVYLPTAPFVRNQTLLFGPEGGQLWQYDKSRPIPGLESYPPGPGHVPTVDTPYGRLATITCFDGDFVDLARVDADILLLPVRDWPEIASVHRENAQLRAVENGYSIVRPAEFGINGGFDYQGRSLAYQNWSTVDDPTVIFDVPTNGSRTPFRKFGQWFAWLSIALSLGFAAVGIQRRRR